MKSLEVAQWGFAIWLLAGGLVSLFSGVVLMVLVIRGLKTTIQ